MAYTARKLITKAYYLSGIVGRDLQSVTGSQLTDGLELLNFLISGKIFDKRFIPYFTETDITAVIGQEKYFLENVVEIESFTFNIGAVRYATYNVGRKAYFGTSRYDTIQSLPFKWHAERCLGGTNLYIYFLPASTYPLKIWAKVGYDNVTENDDLLLVFEEGYLDYLKYELAAKICNEYHISLPSQTAETLEDLRLRMRDPSPIDVSVTKRTRFGTSGSLNYGDINIGKGWRPSS